MLEAALIGTGGMMPLKNRWLASAAIRYNGRIILIDCGEGTQIPFREVGWGFKNVEAIFITHTHTDHIAGLPGLLQTMGNSGRTEPVSIYVTAGDTEIILGLLYSCRVLPFEVNILDITPGENIITLDSLYVTSVNLQHSLPCLGYSFYLRRSGKFNVEKAKKLRIPLKFWSELQKGRDVSFGDMFVTPEMLLGEDRKGIKISYCTDTRPTEGIIDLIRNSDLFICEGMYGGDEDIPKAIEKGHMVFSEAAALAKLGNVGELWLTHFSPALTEPEVFFDNAAGIFPNTYIHNDIYTKVFRFDD